MERKDCKFGSKCYKINKACPFNHDFINGPPSIRECKFGMACRKVNSGCTFSHSMMISDGNTGRVKPTENCKYGEKCHRNDCKFLHQEGRYKDGTCI